MAHCIGITLALCQVLAFSNPVEYLLEGITHKPLLEKSPGFEISRGFQFSCLVSALGLAADQIGYVHTF
jgi:hypothetical protein